MLKSFLNCGSINVVYPSDIEKCQIIWHVHLSNKKRNCVTGFSHFFKSLWIISSSYMRIFINHVDSWGWRGCKNAQKFDRVVYGWPLLRLFPNWTLENCIERICQKSHSTNEVHQRTNGLIFAATKTSHISQFWCQNEPLFDQFITPFIRW